MASLSTSLVNVGVNMVLHDQFSQNAGRVTGAFQSMMNNLSAAGRAVQASYGGVFDVAMSGAKGVFNAYKAYAGVEKDIFLTGKMAGATKQQIRELRDLAESTNLEVPLTTGDIASAERFLAMAGNDVEKIKNMIPSVSKLASIFDIEAGGKGGVADLMTNIMSMYQLDSSMADQVANDLFVATTSANMDPRDLAESIKYSGAEMATMGYGIRETAAAIGLLGDMGIQGSMAGTALANTMRYLRQSLSGQKKSGAAALETLGLSEKDFLRADGEMKDLYSVYKTIAKAIADTGVSGTEAANLITAITGVRGSRNMLAVVRQLNSGQDTYAKLMSAFNTRQGALDQTMNEYQESPQGRLDKFKSTIDAITQRLGQFAADFLNPILDGINAVLGFVFKISEVPIIGWLVKGGIFLTLVSPLVIGVRMMRALVVSLRETIAMTQMALNRMGLSAKAMAQNMAYSQAMMAKANALAPGQRLALANGVYMGMGKNGRTFISYTNAAGKRHRMSDPNRMQDWLVSQSNPRGGNGAKAMAQNMAYSQAMMAKANALAPGQRLALANGVYMGMGKNGRTFISYTNAAGKRHRMSDPNRMQDWLVSQSNPRGGNGAQTGQRDTFGSWFPKGQGFTGAMKGMGRGLLRVGGAIAGLAGGPIGIVLMAATTLLPSLIDALSSNTNAQEEQRRALEEQRQKIRDMSAQDYFAYREKKLMAAWNGVLGKAVGTVTVNINGRPMIAGAGDSINVDDLYGLADILTQE